MKKATFFVAFYSRKELEPDEYLENAPDFEAKIVSIFRDKQKLLTFLRTDDVSSCHTEIEISYDRAPDGGMLVAKCVLDIEAESKIAVDKTKLTTLAKSATGMNLKVEKRLVPAD